MAAQTTDPYAILGVARTATAAEIRAAYQKLVRKFHPDLHQGNPLEELASERLAQINGAYHLLSDPTRRASYDAGDLAGGRRAGASATAGSQPPNNRGMNRLINRTIMGLGLALVVIPLVVRLGGVALRGLLALTRSLVEAAASLPGGRPTAAAGLGLLVLVALWLRRRRRRP